jgi:hypothetical protein
MVARRRRTSILRRDSVESTGAGGGETFRPSATGAYIRRVATPTGAAPFGSLPDALSIVHDADCGVPQMPHLDRE